MSELNSFNCSCNQKESSSDLKNISIDSFSISIGKKKLFENSSLKITYGSKYGFIGKNGCGKTTLLKHLSLKKLPIQKDMDILYVEQEVKPSSKTAFETVLEANVERTVAINYRDDIVKKLEETGDNSLIKELEKIENKLTSMEIDKDESIVRKILKGLGFNEEDQNKPTSDFSGGWRMRISIARALYLKPTLLLLDEPTNHLDLNASIWLTWYLESWPNSLFVVSHDQGFLNDVCDNIVNIEDNVLEYYKGNFHKFKSAYKQKLDHKRKEWEKVEKHVKAMRKKSKPKKEVNEFIAKKEKQGITKLDKEYVVRIDFAEVGELPRPLVDMSQVSFGYTPDKKIFNNINFGLDMDSRITLVGPNGVGKSTFIKLMVGELKAEEGYVSRKNALRIGYYHQHFDSYLPMNQTPIEYIKSVYKPDKNEQELVGSNLEQFVRKNLGTISLEGAAHTQKIGSLSGGQKARVALVSLILQRPHILLLDEPTNHLDIESINGLIEGINNFNGCVFIISHDSELITRTDSQLWVVNNKSIYEFDGEYEDYRDTIIEELQ
ncbi:ABC transporter [seawater metagenome]|uniref:ABC transporter n=1 Tax=seawater metagenome TaxID=1561972 RepID=A0A5E8CJ70_9ZZZZ